MNMFWKDMVATPVPWCVLSNRSWVTQLQRGRFTTCSAGPAIFVAVVAVVVSMKFRLKIAGRGPHAHFPCPGLCGCRGPRWRRAQRLPASCHEASSGPFLGCPGRLLPCRSRAAGSVQRASETRLSRARRLQRVLPRLIVELRESIGSLALQVA